MLLTASGEREKGEWNDDEGVNGGGGWDGEAYEVE